MKLFIHALFLFAPLMTWAFPEMIRYGYNNCSACHVSSSGGGALTTYGRALSSELLSTWGSEKEAGFLHGAVDQEKIQDWLAIGGDYRSLQYHYENDKVKDGQWVNMQASAEFAINFKNWIFDLAFGRFDNDAHWSSSSNKYFIQAPLNDFFNIRAGRFLPNFGLNIPEHISPTRSFLGFGSYDQKDSLEVNYADEAWNITTAYNQAPNDSAYAQEKGLSLKIESILHDTFKPGVSYWVSENSKSKRQIIATQGSFGFSKKLFLLSEIDWQEVTTKESQTIKHSATTYHKLGYEFYKGVVGFAVLDGQLTQLESPATQTEHYGVGAQFFPRPHFEFEGVFTFEHSPQVTLQESQYAWIVLHYYL